MKKKEEEIMNLIRFNPFITQNELAEKLSLSRSAVAGYISSLTRAGHLAGRAYIINERDKIVCVGGANLDRKAKADKDIQWYDSNPVQTSETPGGVARNTAENLSLLNLPVELLTVTGDDAAGKTVRESAPLADISPSLILPDSRTGTYTAVLNHENDMAVALADMAIYDQLTPEDLNRSVNRIQNAYMVIMDTNFSKEVLAAICAGKNREKQIFAAIAVSAQKINRLPDDLSSLDYLLMNEKELDMLVYERFPFSGETVVSSEQKLKRVQEAGVANVIVTRGAEGAFYLTDEGHYGHCPAEKTDVRDVTGAGDAFASGVFYAVYHGRPLGEACKFGARLANITLETDASVVKDLNEQIFEPLKTEGGES